MSEDFNGGINSQEKKEEKHTIELGDGYSIVVEETEPGIFKIVDENISDKDGNPKYDPTDIAFKKWDESVENLDAGEYPSDVFMSFNMSHHLKWQDVELKLEGRFREIKAPSLDRVKEALTHIKIGSYCRGDI